VTGPSGPLTRRHDVELPAGQKLPRPSMNEIPIKDSIVLPKHHRTFKLDRPARLSPKMC
jgi:hypothetical protein